MNIWIVNHYALPPDNAGGTRHYNFARQLQQRGHHVTIIASNFNHFSHKNMTSSENIGKLDNTYDVPFIWIPVPAYQGNTIGRFWNMIQFCHQLLKNPVLRKLPAPDVMIGSSPHLFAALGAQRLASRFNIPFVLEVRDLWPESLVDLGRFTHKHPLIKVMRFLESWLYKKADRIISLLPNAHQYFIQRNVKPKNILWIPNSVDTNGVPDHFATENPNNKFTVMYAGAHGVANDLDTVLDAAKMLEKNGLSDKITICLMGEGPEKSRLQQRVENEKINIISFKDPVPKKKVYTELNKADVFLMLLKDSPVFRWGISPNKLFDYLVMEKPVIFCVNTPFNPVEQYNAGISAKPGDPTALANAIEKLSLTPADELKEMGQRGKQFVMENHYLPKLTDSLEKLLEEVIA